MIIVLDASAGIEIALSRDNAAIFEKKIENASKIITSDLLSLSYLRTQYKPVLEFRRIL